MLSSVTSRLLPDEAGAGDLSADWYSRLGDHLEAYHATPDPIGKCQHNELTSHGEKWPYSVTGFHLSLPQAIAEHVAGDPGPRPLVPCTRLFRRLNTCARASLHFRGRSHGDPSDTYPGLAETQTSSLKVDE
jgi:hypothetical protein